MKLVTLQENLNKGLAIASRSVASKAQLPVLNNVLLATDKGRLRLSATNLEIGVNYWIGAKIEEEGAISIPAKILAEFVSTLPAEKIDLEVKENSLFLTCGAFKADFIGLSPSEFPAVPTLKDKETLSFEAKELSEAVGKVVFAAATDESRPQLSGVLVVLKDNTLTLVATDGYRLSLKKMGGLKGISEIKELQKGLIIPGRALAEIAKIIGDQESKEKVILAITPEANQVIFQAGDGEIVSRLIEGKFPDFEKIMPEKRTTKIIVETEMLLKAVRIASILARDSANLVKFNIGEGKLQISANTAQVGSNVSEIEAKVEGEGNKIAFNSRYLLDFLNSVGEDLVGFEMTSPLNPGVFKPVKDASYLHIIMPVRVQE